MSESYLSDFTVSKSPFPDTVVVSYWAKLMKPSLATGNTIRDAFPFLWPFVSHEWEYHTHVIKKEGLLFWVRSAFPFLFLWGDDGYTAISIPDDDFIRIHFKL